MKIKTFLSFVIFFILFDNLAFAQYQIDGVTYLPSIQSRNYIKYGGLQSHDLNTGTVFTRIPLYSYRDNDFTIPLSVDYASTGLIPNVQTGILGLGWYLNAGGCILREVKGIPDNSEKGFLNAHQSNTAINWDVMITNNRNDSDCAYTTFLDGTETESDIYHFRFLGYSGSFRLGSNKAVYIYNSSHPKGEYRIDFSQLRQSNMISITTGDGYKYIFGGQFQNELDKTLNNGSSFRQDYNLTWVLSRIESPNGRFVAFTYSQPLLNDVCRQTSYYYKKSYTDFATDWTDEYNVLSYETELRTAQYSQYDINLKSINIDDRITAVFVYEAKYSKESTCLPPNGSVRPMNNNTGLLSRIELKDLAGDKVLKTIDFSYRPANQANYTTFLYNICLSDNEYYSFSYYKLSSAYYPWHGAAQIDHWGYNNSTRPNNEIVSLLPRLSCNSNNIESVNSQEREPNFETAQYGMLTRITSPTNGYTVFEYEGNSYSLKVDRNNLTQGLPAIIAKNIGGLSYGDAAEYPAGGVRLKKVINYSAANESSTTEYLYKDKTGKNSGILLHYPRYINGVITRHDSLNIPVYQKIIKREGSDFASSYVDRHHIEYYSVLEKHPDNSFIEYRFTNYKTTPDELSIVDSDKILANGNEINVISPISDYQYDSRTASNSHLRGALAEKVINNSEGASVRKYIYNYNYLNQAPPYLSLQKTCSNVYLYKENTNDKYLTEESQINYFDGDSIVQKQHYSYNSSGRLISEMNTNNGRTVESVTYYADSISSSPFRNISKESTNWNYLILEKKNSPIGELTYSNGRIIGGKIYHYALLTNKLGQQYCVLSKIGSLKKRGINQDVINENSFELESQNNLFGAEGQVLQRTNSNNSVSSFIWGYKGLYIIAEISGVPFDVIKQTLGASKFSNEIYTEDSLAPADEAKLRSIPNSLVKTFTFVPFVGVKSVSDYNGNKTSFEYNNAGKLTKVTDNNGAAIEEYEYNNGSSL